MSIIPPQIYDFDGTPTPGYIARLNYIARFVLDPCDADVSLYVELAAEPAGNLAAGILGVDPVDIAKNIHAPRDAATCRKRRKKGRRRGRNLGIPDIDQQVADRVNESARFKKTFQKGKRAAFIIAASKIERLAWQWFLFDLVSEAFYDWFSEVVKSEQCQANTYGRARLTNGSFNDIGSANDTTFPLNGDWTETHPGYGTIGLTGNYERPFNVAFQATGTGLTLGDADVTFTLEHTHAGRKTILDQQTVFIQQGQSDTVMLMGEAPSKGTVAVKYSKPSSWQQWTDVQMSNVGQPGNIF